MFLIQGASFLMTLVSNGILSTNGSHMAYTVMLVLPYLGGMQSMMFMKPWELPGDCRRYGDQIIQYQMWQKVYVIPRSTALASRVALHGLILAVSTPSFVYTIPVLAGHGRAWHIF